MIKSLIVFVLIILLIIIYLKKFTYYRCPKCKSRNIHKVKDKFDENNRQIYYCIECKKEISK